MRTCENCLFHDKDGWACKCSIKQRYTPRNNVCKDWEDENIIIDTVYCKGEYTPEQTLDLKRQVVSFMRYAKEQK